MARKGINWTSLLSPPPKKPIIPKHYMKMRAAELPDRYVLAYEWGYISDSHLREIELGIKKVKTRNKTLKILSLSALVQVFYLSSFLSLFF